MTDFNNAWLGKGIIEQLKADFTIPDSNEPITWENVYKFLFGEPTVDKVSYGIKRRVNDTLYLDRNMYSSLFLSFQTEELAKKFLNNFRDLIEEAGDLI